ncbi:MAG TPA: hypothetical protein VGN42_08955, partial [Pirellulales bacterium]|nr:hypothetical protein [Pirellulales bacterium]
MLNRSWLPNLHGRLQPVSRSQRRRNRRAKSAHRFEQLERRALLTSLVSAPQSFDVNNQSQFGSGSALVSSGSYFLGAQNFDTGEQTVGGFVTPLGVKTGVQASVDLNGTAGL